MKIIIFCIFWFPLMALNKDLFYAKLSEPTPQWMIEQIEEDLAPYTKELSKKHLNQLYTQDNLYLVRVRVAKGKLHIQKSKHAEKESTSNRISAALLKLSKIITLPDIDFLFTAHDAIYENAPIFSFTKEPGLPGVIIMPDMFSLEGLEPLKSLILEGNKIYNWDSKINTLYYRGSDGGNPDLTKWLNQPRTRLIALSKQHPDYIDAKFTGLYGTFHLTYAKQQGFMADYVSMKDHPRYKYLINVDALCAATPRVPVLLHSNSVFFKNRAASILWFYRTLKPYENYIPVAEDLSDLITQVEWARAHDEECKKISENARKLAEEVLTEETVYLYFYRLMEAYSKKQQSQYHLK